MELASYPLPSASSFLPCNSKNETHRDNDTAKITQQIKRQKTDYVSQVARRTSTVTKILRQTLRSTAVKMLRSSDALAIPIRFTI
jgi:hypothetical protein